MRYRITVRGENTELRGYLVPTDNNMLSELAECMKPFGMVVASAADDTYDPFREEQARELHHFETEQENERLRAEIARLTENDPVRTQHNMAVSQSRGFIPPGAQ